MKLCLVYSPHDSKLRHNGAYCSIFKDMFNALVKRFRCFQFITSDCSAEDIDADLIFFFDPHATHHIKIDGIKNHPAVKMEYWNDLHQSDIRGVNRTSGVKFHKLGARQRSERFLARGSDYIVCPVKSFFHERFQEYLDTEKALLHFPHAPNLDGFSDVPYEDRANDIIGNGATWGGWNNGYDFRAWAFERPQIKVVEHWVKNKTSAMGGAFLPMLSQYKGALALCTPFIVPKYIEIPAAGCVTFAEYHKDYEDLGFKDGETCIYVNKSNFDEITTDFLLHPEDYTDIAGEGARLVAGNYTAKHFADFIYSCGIGKSRKGSPPLRSPSRIFKEE